MKLLILVVVMSFVIGTVGYPRRMRPRWRGNGRTGIPSCQPGGSSWYHVDNARCNGYYHCYTGVVRHHFCPPGEALKLDSSRVPEACLPRYEVDCQHRHYSPMVIPFRLIRLRITVQAPSIANKVYDIVVPQIPLIYATRLLEQQASSPAFSFASVSNPFLGFGEFIVTINGFTPTGSTHYWAILNPVAEITVAASSYIPHDQEHIVFKVSPLSAHGGQYRRR